MLSDATQTLSWTIEKLSQELAKLPFACDVLTENVVLTREFKEPIEGIGWLGAEAGMAPGKSMVILHSDFLMKKGGGGIPVTVGMLTDTSSYIEFVQTPEGKSGVMWLYSQYIALQYKIVKLKRMAPGVVYFVHNNEELELVRQYLLAPANNDKHLFKAVMDSGVQMASHLGTYEERSTALGFA